MQEFMRSLLDPTVLGSIVEVLLGVIASFAADWIPGFVELSARVKRLLWLVVPIVLSVGATWLLGATTNDDIFNALRVGLLVFLGSQAAHARKL